MRLPTRSLIALTAGSTFLLGACKPRATAPYDDGGSLASSSAASGPSASASADVPGLRPVVRQVGDAGPLATGIPVAQTTIDAEVNPDHRPPYDGPTGTVEGVVRVRGDEAPNVDVAIPFECAGAHDTYGRLFREGAGRTVGDVLVAVTGYDAYLPPQREAVPVAIAACAYDRRTIGMMFGQYLAVSNTDQRLSFVPTLLGADLPAELVALPRGDVVRLYPRAIGHYALSDAMNRTWMYADVFVVRYRTHAVTGVDGSFRIERVPVGKLKVSAYLPAIDASLHPDQGVAEPAVEQAIELAADQTLKLDLTLDYRRPKTKPKPKSSAPPPPVIH